MPVTKKSFPARVISYCRPATPSKQTPATAMRDRRPDPPAALPPPAGISGLGMSDGLGYQITRDEGCGSAERYIVVDRTGRVNAVSEPVAFLIEARFQQRP